MDVSVSVRVRVRVRVCVCMCVCVQALSEGARQRRNSQRKRQKREWIISPKLLTENEDHRHLDFVAKVRNVVRIVGDPCRNNPKSSS